MPRRRTNRPVRNNVRLNRRRCVLEPLEKRNLLAVVFADSFEAGGGTGDWAGNWAEDAQNDWFRSTQRATDGAYSAEVDGSASDATLTLATPIDLSGYALPQLTFDWLIESGFDSGEYLALDVSTDGGSSWQTDVLRLDGNVDAENTWHSETVDLTSYASDNLIVRFRSKVSRSNEDANVDNVQITATPAGPPMISISDAALDEAGSIDVLVPAGTGGLDSPKGMRLHDDGLLYVVSQGNNSVLRFDATTGDFIDVFVTSGSGGLSNAIDVEFMPGGDLLVGSRGTDEVLRYDGVTGAFLGAFVTAGSGGIDGASDLRYGPDGNLYVSGFVSGTVLRYDGATGAFLDVFIGDDPTTTAVDESGGLKNPTGFAFDEAGNFSIVSFGTYQVLNYDPLGNPLGELYAMQSGRGAAIAFGADGDLYLTDYQDHRVLRLDGNTGTLVGEVMKDPAVFLRARSLLFDNIGNLIVTAGESDNIVRLSTGPLVTLSHSSTETITVDFATANGTAVSPDDYLSASGTLTFAPGETEKRVLLTPVDDAGAEADEMFEVALTNPAGATLTDAVGVVTIVDDDSNSPPVAVDDSSNATSEVEQIIDVLANDSDPDGDPLVIDSAQSPTPGGGNVVINPDNTLSYTSAPGFTGADSFSYTISDGQGGTATATVTVDVSQASTTSMFVSDITFQSRKGNKQWRAIFDVRDEFGAAVSGASITVTFAGQTYSGQTDGNGQFRTNWLRLSSSSYEAEVTDLALLDYSWDLTQGVPDSGDADPYPDRTLTF